MTSNYNSMGPPPTGPPPLSNSNNSYSNPYSNIQPNTPPKQTHNLNIYKDTNTNAPTTTNTISNNNNNNNIILSTTPTKESNGLSNIPESPNTAGKFIEKSLGDLDDLISERRKAILDLRKSNKLRFGVNI
jgi:hypothetical protein